MNGAARQLLRAAVKVRDATPVPSPCISVCRMDDASGLCGGCFRTLDEIAAWATLDDDAKRVVWRRLVERASKDAMSS